MEKVYTSGTTGDPKGVMLTHGNFLSNVQGVASIAGVTSNDLLLSLLPLSHVLERTAGYYVPILGGAAIAYAEGMDSIAANLLEVRPTVCCAVPRLFEKIYTRLVKKMEESGPLKKRIFQWALSVGRNHSSGLAHALADRLVYKKVRQSMGGRLRFFVSGGAALSREIIEFFRSLGVIIYEGYGLTESSPVVSFNFGKNFKPGTVGKVLPGVQVKFSPEGEILVKGPNVMKGYFNNPKATAESIDPDGWLHTGDVGVFDDDNYLKITELTVDAGEITPTLKLKRRILERKFSSVIEKMYPEG